MSSSNEIDLIYVEEVTYGVTPAATAFDTFRKISDSLSGTPDTVVSDEARSDRQSDGQTIVGLQVGGATAWQLSRGKFFDDMIAAAFYTDWTAGDTEAAIACDITMGANGVGTIDRSVGDFTTTFSGGTFGEISGAVSVENDEVILITSVSALSIGFVGPETMITEATNTIALDELEYVQVGTIRKSFSIEKQFLDIGKFISYKGMRLAGMKLDATVKQPVTGEFSFAGATHNTPTVSISDGETVNPADTSPFINPQVDMGYISVDGEVAQYTIESISIELNNNVSPEEGVGKVGANDQVPFEAMFNVSMTAHLTAANFALLGNKISQVPISVSFFLRDPNGDGYAVYLPEVQVSFPDPMMPGKNQHVMLDMTGVARISSSINNTARIARIGVI